MKTAADLIVLNASLWSGALLPDADAIAVVDGRILGAGRGSDLAALQGEATRVIDARGATVTPGLTDAHIHLVAWARSLHELDLNGCASRAQALERVTRHLAAHPGDGLVVGRGWNANGWSETPDRASLDAVSGDRPILLHSKDFHAVWSNSAGLRAAGIGCRTPDPAGGRIERDAAGEPSGVLREHAVRLCAPLESAARTPGLDQVRAAAHRLLAHGVTAVHDFEDAEAQRVLSALSRGPHPRVRVLMHLPHAALDHALALGLQSGVGDDRFRLGAIKLFADGTLGSRTAAMLAPYDGTVDRGMELLSAAELRDTVRRALEGGLSVAVHAIGDRACRSVLDAFQAVLEHIPAAPLPPRIEHAQLLDPADLPRVSRLGLAASMQPVHCVSDFELAERYWGSRRRGAYAWRSLLESGAPLAFGSDAPVESPSVALGLHAATTRERPGRPGAFVPEERIGLDQALAAYTEGPARLAGNWPGIGSLRSGARADLVVWNADLHRLHPSALCDAYPVVTVMDGDVVYTRDSDPEARGDAFPAIEEVRAAGRREAW